MWLATAHITTTPGVYSSLRFSREEIVLRCMNTLRLTFTVKQIGVTQDSHRRHLVEGGFRLNSPACRQRRKKDSQSRNLSTPLYKQKSNTQSSLLKTDYKPYLTLFHADISLALSLSISSSSPAASLLAP